MRFQSSPGLGVMRHLECCCLADLCVADTVLALDLPRGVGEPFTRHTPAVSRVTATTPTPSTTLRCLGSWCCGLRSVRPFLDFRPYSIA